MPPDRGLRVEYRSLGPYLSISCRADNDAGSHKVGLRVLGCSNMQTYVLCVGGGRGGGGTLNISGRTMQFEKALPHGAPAVSENPIQS